MLLGKGGVRELCGRGGVIDQAFSRGTLLLAVPAFCYAAQNVLFFTALSNLSAATYQVGSRAPRASPAAPAVLSTPARQGVT